MKNVSKIISVSLLCGAAVLTVATGYGTDSSKLVEENEQLRRENARLKNEVARLKGENPPFLLDKNRASVQPVSQSSAPAGPIVGSLSSKPGWVLTQANAAKEWRDTNKLRAVSPNDTKLSWEKFKNDPSIASKIQELKANDNKSPKELAEAVLKLLKAFKVDVNDETVRNTLIFPLIVEVYQPKSKDEETVKGQVKKAARFMQMLNGKRPDLLQIRKMRTLLQEGR
jgi:hypothetical protein